MAADLAASCKAEIEKRGVVKGRKRRQPRPAGVQDYRNASERTVRSIKIVNSKGKSNVPAVSQEGEEVRRW